MKTALTAAAVLGALGLVACEPTEKTSDAVSSPIVPADSTTTSPAVSDPVGGLVSEAPPAPGSTPPASRSTTQAAPQSED